MLMLTIAAKSIPQGVGMLIKFGTIVQEQSTQRALSWSALRSGSDIPELRGVFLRKDFPVMFPENPGGVIRLRRGPIEAVLSDRV